MRVLIGVVVATTIIWRSAGCGYAAEDGDLNLWTDVSISRAREQWKWTLVEQVKRYDDASRTFYYHTDAGLTRLAAPWLDAGLNFREIRENKNGEWETEHRAHLNGTLKFPLMGCRISQRNRLEYRMPEGADNKWRYRSKLTAALPRKFTSAGINPYLAYEALFDLHGDNLTENRAYAGLQARPAKFLKADLSYMWQTLYRNSDWLDLHVIYVALGMEI